MHKITVKMPEPVAKSLTGAAKHFGLMRDFWIAKAIQKVDFEELTPRKLGKGKNVSIALPTPVIKRLQDLTDYAGVSRDQYFQDVVISAYNQLIYQTTEINLQD